MIVPVTVKDGAGRLVAGLEREDFQLFADNIEQQIRLFTSDPYPLSAVVLVDDDLAQKAAEQVQKSLVSISAGFGPQDEVALVTYEAFPQTVADFSFDNDLLFTQLKRLDLHSHTTAIIADPVTAGPVINGNTEPNGQGRATIQGGIPIHGSSRPQVQADLNDALYAAGDMLKNRGRDRRKIIFLISDGTNSTGNQHTFDETLHTLQESDILVYSISVSHFLPIGKSLVERGAAELEKYARDTGGDTFYAEKQGDLERLYSDVTEEAREQYTLTFQPSGVDRNANFHPIEVRVMRAGLNVLARQGYYQSANPIGR